MSKHFFRPSMALYGLWSRFDVVQQLASDMENIVESKINELGERWEGLREVEDEEYRDHLSDSLADEHHSYQKEWIPLIRESLLLSICSSFEFHLGRLCDEYAAACKSPFRISDLNDRGIKRCRTMLRRLGVDDVAFGASWNALAQIFEIRNKIAHAGGFYDDSIRKKIGARSDVFEQCEEFNRSIKIRADGIQVVCEHMTEALRLVNRNLYLPSTENRTEQGGGGQAATRSEST
ncbi:MAG: hypothetical protein P1U58_03825 [Verrucomicrobiales bacterium]|nr:hypothetical protein [Verrucomicrobiales bacterium]